MTDFIYLGIASYIGQFLVGVAILAGLIVLMGAGWLLLMGWHMLCTVGRNVRQAMGLGSGQ